MFIQFLKQKLLFPLEILKYVTFVKLQYTVNIVLPLFAKVGSWNNCLHILLDTRILSKMREDLG